MLSSGNHPHQDSFFDATLWTFLDQNDPLVLLADAFDWASIEGGLSEYYTKDNGRPALPLRLMAGLLILKQLENLSDDQLVLQCKRNPYYQYFCGLPCFKNQVPCHASELSKFRKRIGPEGVSLIFQCSVHLHGEKIEAPVVNIDSTVQEKYITYPTDGKLAIKIINRLNKLAKAHGIQQRRTFVKETKELRLSLRFFRHVKRRKKAVKAVKRLRTIAGILLRELQRKLTQESLSCYEKDFERYEKVLKQKKYDKDKIYSLHEPQVYCVAKGKDHKPYEYGTKASIVSTAKDGIILAAVNHEKNINDARTLEEVLGQAHKVRKTQIAQAVCDRGYRGVSAVGQTEIVLPKKPLKRDNRYQREKKRRLCRQRAAIEPVIGHLKQHYRLSRNYLKGHKGDAINLFMSACAWNLKKWINSALEALFWVLKLSKVARYMGLKSLSELFGLFGRWLSL